MNDNVDSVVLRPITLDNYTIDASGRPYMQCECGRWTHHVSVRLTWLCKCGKEWRSTQAAQDAYDDEYARW